SYYTLFARFDFVRDWVPNTAFDTGIAAYLLNPNAGKYELETLYFTEFHRPVSNGPAPEPVQTDLFGLLDTAEGGVPQNAGDPVASFREEARSAAEAALAETEAVEALMTVYAFRLESEGLMRVFKDCELPLVEAMATMEANGFRTEPETLILAGEDLSVRIAEKQKTIYGLAGEEFNIQSPKQLGTVLFEKLMLPAGKKTKTGWSTNADVLENLRSQHPIVNEILEYRTLAKLKSTYVDGMLPLIADDGRIHAHFQQTVASTGRISCTEPNLQNIPVRFEEGRKLRKAFVPNGPDEILVGADYSQIELRVLACLSGDESLLSAFRNGEDIHRATAANVLGKAPEDVTSEERSAAKAINFGLIYGKTSFGLSNDLHISVKAAEDYIDRYFAKYPTVRAYLDGLKAAARETGYATTLLGRKRPIPEITASQYMVRQLGERLAMNSPIQGTAADVIKLAMVRVDRALKKANYRSRLILQVHDELIISCAKDEIEAVKKLLIDNMETAVDLAIPLRADLETADNWYDL
ncbi:MAG: DNA polymerase I, partial [Firmicutes bacterium]|nr:DNA polymerase I [Bacillota bacterium]